MDCLGMRPPRGVTFSVSWRADHAPAPLSTLVRCRRRHQSSPCRATCRPAGKNHITSWYVRSMPPTGLRRHVVRLGITMHAAPTGLRQPATRPPFLFRPSRSCTVLVMLPSRPPPSSRHRRRPPTPPAFPHPTRAHLITKLAPHPRPGQSSPPSFIHASSVTRLHPPSRQALPSPASSSPSCPHPCPGPLLHRHRTIIHLTCAHALTCAQRPLAQCAPHIGKVVGMPAHR
jgi:hypothetical protein